MIGEYGFFFLILLIGFGGMWVQGRLRSRFKKYSTLHLRSNLSGKEVAEMMLRDNGIHDVKVISVPGQLTDHYNPIKKTVHLSSVVYNERNAAAAAV
ncbi:MAG: zinc metallopeptidase, partial [Flavobacteriales bacterium]|nr:zinc metallopeptidase [Flavobacteriales bacterium]